MKRSLCIVLKVTAAIVCLAAIVFGLLYAGGKLPFLSREGWAAEDGGDTLYLDYFGKPLTGWQQLGEERFYFDAKTGALQTGWLVQGDKIYYLDKAGVMQTGWQQIEEKDYYLFEDGTLATGWQQIDEATYYLGTDGVKRTYWHNIDGKKYYFRSTGKLATGWLDLEGKRYYLLPDGALTTGWQDIGQYRYYMGTDGAMHIGWLELDGKLYHTKANGVMATGWLERKGKQYYFGSDGAALTGWQEIDGEKHFFGSDGVLTGWQVTDGVYSYLDANGKPVTGEALFASVEEAFSFTEDCTILLGKDNPLPEDWQAFPIEVEDGWMVDARCYNQFVRMLADCRAAGNETGINSAYRSPEDQQEIWDNRVALYMSEGATEEEAIARVRTEVAIPGYSEHQLGFAVDIDGFAAHVWMAENCWKYGFIIRYPEDKQDITGTVYEPWHVRFVGYELAELLHTNGWCLEEYYAQL